MPKTTAQKLAQARFEGKTYEPINIRVLIGERDQINAAARARGESLNAYVRRAIAAQMERDGLPESERIPATIEHAAKSRKNKLQSYEATHHWSCPLWARGLKCQPERAVTSCHLLS